MDEKVRVFYPGEYYRLSEKIQVWQDDTYGERIVLYVPDECPCCAADYHYSHSIELGREGLARWVAFFQKVLEELGPAPSAAESEDV